MASSFVLHVPRKISPIIDFSIAPCDELNIFASQQAM